MGIVYFATSSDIKFRQYDYIFQEFGISLEQGTVINNTLIEPQFDPDNPAGLSNLILHPLRLASRFISKNKQLPYVIEDTMLLIDSFSKSFESGVGLPGADTKNWWVNLGTDGLLKLMENDCNRKAKFVCQLGAYIGAGKYVFANAHTSGTISRESIISLEAQRDFPISNPYYFHQIFKPEGAMKGLGEMKGKEFKEYDYRRKCVKVFIEKLGKEDLVFIDSYEQFNLFE